MHYIKFTCSNSIVGCVYKRLHTVTFWNTWKSVMRDGVQETGDQLTKTLPSATLMQKH